jgi:Flp pilus assembly protein TadB
MKDKRQETQQVIGAAVIVLVAVAVVVGAVYLVTGAVGMDALRWWATVATLAVPVVIVIAWRVATKAAREHLTGFNRGLDGAERTMQSVGRGLSATASMARAVKSQPAPAHNDLLPQVGRMRIVEESRDDSQVIDL